MDQDPTPVRLGVLKSTIRRVLKEYGTDSTQNQGLHSWRCQYPDRYPECSHFEELVDTLAKAVHKEEVK